MGTEYILFWAPRSDSSISSMATIIMAEDRTFQQQVASIYGTNAFLTKFKDDCLAIGYTWVEQDWCTLLANYNTLEPIVTCANCKQQHKVTGYFKQVNESGVLMVEVQPHFCKLTTPKPEVLDHSEIPIHRSKEYLDRGLEYDPGLEQLEICKQCGEPLDIVQKGFVANGPYLVNRRCKNGHTKIRRLSDYSHQQYLQNA